MEIELNVLNKMVNITSLHATSVIINTRKCLIEVQNPLFVNSLFIRTLIDWCVRVYYAVTINSNRKFQSLRQVVVISLIRTTVLFYTLTFYWLPTTESIYTVHWCMIEGIFSLRKYSRIFRMWLGNKVL